MQHCFQQTGILSKATCFGTCVPTSGSIFKLAVNVSCTWHTYIDLHVNLLCVHDTLIGT
jgi:hypothetical protein